MQRRDFDLLVPNKHVRIRVRPTTHSELPGLFALANEHIPDLAASYSKVEQVWANDCESILLIERDGVPVGVYSMLFLNGEGLNRLIMGSLDTVEPDLNTLVAAGDAPSAIYTWAVVAPGLAAEGIRHTSVYLRKPRFRNVNLYARATTASARKIMEHLGYELLGSGFPDLHRYVRWPNRTVSDRTAA